MSKFTVKPAQVFAAINNATNQPAASHTAKLKNVLSSDPNKFSLVLAEETGVSSKDLQVTALGEMVLPPDVCRLVISVTSRKETAQDVKNSVSRRLDYVLQTLRNHQIRDSDFKVSQSLQRIDGQYQLDADILVHFHDFNKFLPICNLLVEKLDEHVRLSGPEFDHTPNKLEAVRRQASVLSLRNGKQKAAELAQVVGAKVGRVLGIREDSITKCEVATMETSRDAGQPKTFDQCVKDATLHISAKLTVTFELISKLKLKE